MSFKQNNEITLTDNRYVAENTFIGKTPENKELPKFENEKDKLPLPVWDGHDDVIRCYYKAWQLAFGNLCRPEKGSGFVSNFIDTAFNGCIFMWDSSFILMFGKYADRIFKFQNTLDNFYSHQHRDGFICREIHEDNGEDSFTRHDPASTGPDIMPWCEWVYFENFGDKERLARVFPPLLAYHQWMSENHTWQDGTYWSSGWGCGMDNLPRVEDGYSPMFSNGHMTWNDACMQELMDCNILMKMAEVLNRQADTDYLTVERDRLEKVVNETLWDEKTAFYYDKWKNGELNMVKHIGAFWSLVAGAVPQERAERFIAHLENENEFCRPHMVPALSHDHSWYNADGGYWAGGVWAPTNYMVLCGLDKYNQFDMSYKIARNHLECVVSVFNETGTLYENYAPELVHDGKPWHGRPAKGDFVGWTGIVPVAVLFEFVFGIKPDAANNKIVWHINLTERHGVERYPFGTHGELTLLCEKRTNTTDKPICTIKSNILVTVELVWDGGSETVSIG